MGEMEIYSLDHGETKDPGVEHFHPLPRPSIQYICIVDDASLLTSGVQWRPAYTVTGRSIGWLFWRRSGSRGQTGSPHRLPDA